MITHPEREKMSAGEKILQSIGEALVFGAKCYFAAHIFKLVFGS